jgi:hypothetical protein
MLPNNQKAGRRVDTSVCERERERERVPMMNVPKIEK